MEKFTGRNVYSTCLMCLEGCGADSALMSVRRIPVINFEIIKPNMPVFVKDEDFKIDVEQEIMSRYLDRKYHENLLNRVFLERIQEKGGF